MGITLWYSPLPGSQFHSNFNNLVSSVSTLIPSNKINIQYNEFEHLSESKNGNFKPFNRYGFNFLPPHITLIKNIPNDNETFNKIIRIISTTLHSETDEKENNIVIQDVKFNNKFFENCILEVKKRSIYILLSLIAIITDLVKEIPKSDSAEFKPHVSLTYSDYKFDSETDREMVIERVKTYLKFTIPEENISGNIDWDVKISNSNKSQKSGRFYIVNCEGPIDQWTVLRYIDI
ncbi:hypothetical protein QEN19_004400 [Hanseniaspora menglaensis]